MSQLLAKIRKIFSSEGSLAQKIPGYAPRTVQVEMAVAVATALENSDVLLAEAGTGTGKTYAYLIPSILSGKKVIISTGTKNLQDQLFHRDIPLLRKALGISFTVALLKGRSNYLCHHRLQTHLHNQRKLESLRSLVAIKEWADVSHSGELEQFSGKIDSTLVPFITSTTDNCLGVECNYFNKCFLFKARRQAQESNIIIINHHLFFADNLLKASSTSEVLPNVEAVIFDEAHQLPEIATQFLGETLSSKQILYLARDVLTEAAIEAPEMLDLKILCERLSAATSFWFASFGAPQRGAWVEIANQPQHIAAISNFQQIILELLQALQTLSVRGKGLENCCKRTHELLVRFNRLTSIDSEGNIHWYEVSDDMFALHHSPLYIGNFFQQLPMAKNQTWIFTSATLSLNGDFSHFEFGLGLKQTVKLHLASPFDFAKQALMYLPIHSSEPNSDLYLSNILEHALPLLRLTKGRTFFLFTSHRALKEAARKLSTILTNPLLIQGEAPKSKLLNMFCSLDNAILLGTSSFWEGVDIKDNHLHCVIIDKIPFMVPDDPVLKARVEFYRGQGKNPFTEYQLPHAVIAMRQGVGRLIRATNDKGVLMICDPRLLTKSYGKTVLRSLPPMSVTHSLDDVANFLEMSD